MEKQQKNSQTKFEKIMVKKYSIFDLLKPYNRVILQTQKPMYRFA